MRSSLCDSLSPHSQTTDMRPGNIGNVLQLDHVRVIAKDETASDVGPSRTSNENTMTEKIIRVKLLLATDMHAPFISNNLKANSPSLW